MLEHEMYDEMEKRFDVRKGAHELGKLKDLDRVSYMIGAADAAKVVVEMYNEAKDHLERMVLGLWVMSVTLGLGVIFLVVT